MKKKIIKTLILSAFLCALAMIFRYSKLSDLTGVNNSGLHFNLLTVSAIIAGFMFTNLGLLISVSNHDIIKKIRNTSIIDKKNGRIITGLTYNIISIFISLVFILEIDNILSVLDSLFKVSKPDYFISKIIINYLAIIEIVCLILGFVYFALSIIDINKILTAISLSKNKLPNDLIEKMKNDFNSAKTNH